MSAGPVPQVGQERCGLVGVGSVTKDGARQGGGGICDYFSGLLQGNRRFSSTLPRVIWTKLVCVSHLETLWR